MTYNAQEKALFEAKDAAEAARSPRPLARPPARPTAHPPARLPVPLPARSEITR